MNVRKHCHAKLMPLIIAPLDLSLYLLGFCDLNDYTLCCHWTLNLDNYIYIHCDGECFHLHHGFFIDLCNLYHRNHFFTVIFILVIHISIFLSFPIDRFRSICDLCFIIQKLIWFQLIHINMHKVWIDLIQSDQKHSVVW
jgi:hypothetical protein